MTEVSTAPTSPLRAARLRAGRLASEAAGRLRVAEATVLRWERRETRPTFEDITALLAFYRETDPSLAYEDMADPLPVEASDAQQ